MGARRYFLKNGVEWIADSDRSASAFRLLMMSRMGTEKETAREIEAAHLLEHMFNRYGSKEGTVQKLYELEGQQVESQGESDHCYTLWKYKGPTRHRARIAVLGLQALT